MNMQVRLRIAFAILLVLLTVSTASAHARLIRATPAPGTILGSAPAEVSLKFDEPLELISAMCR
jgi:methionine-rich copper-binding protein CopC